MTPTNLLFINADQHSRHVLGAYGNPVVKTPNLDTLAARGTLFANGYCPFPICVPSRASLATGRYAHTIGSWDNAKPYIGTEAPSWGHRLIEQGHKVTTIGKLHYRRPEDPSGFPDQRIPMHVLEGEGDTFGLLRPLMPQRDQRKYVTGAGPGEMEYTRYDRAIAEEAERYLRTEATGQAKPWALYVSFLHPHLPLVVPAEYFNLYPPESLPLPTQWLPEDWHPHPALQQKRHQGMLDEPLDEPTVRRAMAAYYGMVTFLDEQIGRVLKALEEAGLQDSTRIIYTADHGEMLGAHGLWWKNSMYEESAGVPMIVAGPDVPVGKVSQTPVNAVDCFPAIVEAVGASLAPADADLPGESLFALARQPDHDRTIFAEYHASMSPSGIFMIRDGGFKYIHYVGLEPQLFDLVNDPAETRDLAADPAYADTLARCDAKLREICDPEEVDRRAKADQLARLNAAGGVDAVISGGVRMTYTPAPDQFGPDPEETRARVRFQKPTPA
ncbi:MAG: sulfatase-like hydrolase/transferase [Chloroflexi bacterium]|nr:sulfatase-like hydrolase/transferase [Chloroflexota bacterium]